MHAPPTSTGACTNADQGGQRGPASPPVCGVMAEVAPMDCERVILHFDVDCMYAQVEEVRNPSLRERPLGITQKYLIVTCNYPARKRGVSKLMSIRDALAKCPDLVLVSGEDLTPYRHASDAIYAVLQRYGPAEKCGMDEVWIDVTAEVHRRLGSTVAGQAAGQRALGPGAPAANAVAGAAAGAGPLGWVGHLHRCGEVELVSDTSYRPQDLRAAPSAATAGAATCTTPLPAVQGASVRASPEEGWCALLRAGSWVAADARAAVRRETGFRSSAGIAANKLLSKLCSGIHKPDDQTILPPPEALAFVSPLPVRALPDVGHKTEQQLHQLGVQKVRDLRRFSRAELVSHLGDRTGPMLYCYCRGLDPSPVVPKGPPRSITVEDSFQSASTWQAVQTVLSVLVPDLLLRLEEEWGERRRIPATLQVKWRYAGQGQSRTSASGPMPFLHFQPGPQQQLLNLKPRSSAQPGQEGLASTADANPASQQQQQHQQPHQQQQQQMTGGGSAADAARQRCMQALQRSCLALMQNQIKARAFNLSLINIGTTNFREAAATAGPTRAGQRSGTETRGSGGTNGLASTWRLIPKGAGRAGGERALAVGRGTEGDQEEEDEEEGWEERSFREARCDQGEAERPDASALAAQPGLGGGTGGDAAAFAAAAADRSRQQRRNYDHGGGAPASAAPAAPLGRPRSEPGVAAPALMSKRQERAARDAVAATSPSSFHPVARSHLPPTSTPTNRGGAAASSGSVADVSARTAARPLLPAGTDQTPLAAHGNLSPPWGAPGAHAALVLHGQTVQECGTATVADLPGCRGVVPECGGLASCQVEQQGETGSARDEEGGCAAGQEVGQREGCASGQELKAVEACTTWQGRGLAELGVLGYDIVEGYEEEEEGKEEQGEGDEGTAAATSGASGQSGMVKEDGVATEAEGGGDLAAAARGGVCADGADRGRHLGGKGAAVTDVPAETSCSVAHEPGSTVPHGVGSELPPRQTSRLMELPEGPLAQHPSASQHAQERKRPRSPASSDAGLATAAAGPARSSSQGGLSQQRTGGGKGRGSTTGRGRVGRGGKPEAASRGKTLKHYFGGKH